MTPSPALFMWFLISVIELSIKSETSYAEAAKCVVSVSNSTYVSEPIWHHHVTESSRG